MDERIAAVTSPLILAIDQGTHASRALVLDRQGRTLSSGIENIAIAYPQPDWAEQDGDEIVNSVRVAAAQALQALGERRQDVVAAGLSSQRSSVICWDRVTGRPLSPIFSWQDRRAHVWIDQLHPHADVVHRKSGLFLSPHYGASKLRWALDNLPSVRAALEKKTLCWGPMASFVVFRLCAERPFLADPQCAARTQLWNLQRQDWDPDLLELFGLPDGFLPRSVPTFYSWGTLDLPGTAIPLTAVNGDQSAAVFAFGWPEEDSAYVNIGTSAFVQRALARFPGQVPRQLTGIILDDGETRVYMVEGNVNGAGTALAWVSKEFGIENLTDKLPQWLARPDEPPLFLNGIAGLGGPFWQAEFQSRFVGEGEPWLKVVAVVESIAFLLQANIDHMNQYIPSAQRIRISGGVSLLDGLCQRLACVSGLPVHRRDDPEASARGIAYLACGRPSSWNQGAHEDVFPAQADSGLHARYRRWRALMADATGI
jgi:glycerol kinase